MFMCMCSTNVGFSAETLILVLVWGTYYVPATYVPGISRQSMVPGTYVQYRATSPPKQRAARGRTRLTTVTSISCRSF